MQDLLQTLRQRHLIDNVTSDELGLFLSRPRSVYCGFDPTADSLHLGNLLAIVVLEWFRRHGHTPLPLVGGATGMIGDPSGKQSERELLDEKQVAHNVTAIGAQLEKILLQNEQANDKKGTIDLVNNLDWYGSFSLIPFLRDVGKLFRIGPMLAKEMVRTRMQNEEGMSFTEFSYQLLQAYDFLHLSDTHDCLLQIGGSDQWGNITAGIDLIRRLRSKEAYGLTLPLLTDAQGQKLGKSVRGAIWLSSSKLSTYHFFQELYRTEDAIVVDLLRKLTFISLEELRDLEELFKQGSLAPNALQKRLAEEVTTFVHGAQGLQEALSITANLAPGKQTQLDESTLQTIYQEQGGVEMAADDAVGKLFVDAVCLSGLCSSKAEAKRLIRNGGLYLNNEKVTDEQKIIEQGDLLGSSYLLFGKGKKEKLVVKLNSQASPSTPSLQA